ncbi:hypothetical protein [Halorhodospira halochloris]|uniref:hypothetical protein n=1 Tax=Halorhodospira halochloris TaxID=1052 RepID=UPI001EE898EC|nr:hypothetical protein [Halorhodospira halochloris]MCG5547715.1 hypothetical protein [Halorhodospira halochloris]
MSKTDSSELPEELVVQGEWVRTPANAFRVANIKAVEVDEDKFHIFEYKDGYRKVALYIILILIFVASPASVVVFVDTPLLAIFSGVFILVAGLALLVSFRFMPRHCRVLEVRTKIGLIDRSVWRQGKAKRGKPDVIRNAEQYLRKLAEQSEKETSD